VWRRLAPADFERTGQHNERGVESLAVMLRMAATTCHTSRKSVATSTQ